MFDAPRPAQRYGSAPATRGFGGGSFVNENPLSSSSIYDDGLDPWSTAPSPSPPPMAAAPSLFGSVIGKVHLYAGRLVLMICSGCHCAAYIQSVVRCGGSQRGRGDVCQCAFSHPADIFSASCDYR